jgi:hypothetical protein
VLNFSETKIMQYLLWMSSGDNFSHISKATRMSRNSCLSASPGISSKIVKEWRQFGTHVAMTQCVQL